MKTGATVNGAALDYTKCYDGDTAAAGCGTSDTDNDPGTR